MLLTLVFLNLPFFLLFCLGKPKANGVMAKAVMKAYLLYTIALVNFLASFAFTSCYSCLSAYTTAVFILSFDVVLFFACLVEIIFL